MYMDWERNPILTAPMGRAVGGYERLGPYLYRRFFEKGVVYLNAGMEDQTVDLPNGKYRDALRGDTYMGSLTIPAQSGRILLTIARADTVSMLTAVSARSPHVLLSVETTFTEVGQVTSPRMTEAAPEKVSMLATAAAIAIPPAIVATIHIMKKIRTHLRAS